MRTIQSVTSDEVETDLMEIEFIQVSHQLTQPRSRNQIKLPSVTKPVVKIPLKEFNFWKKKNNYGTMASGSSKNEILQALIYACALTYVYI